MAITKVQEGSITLPPDIKEALGLEEGETLYAEVVAGGVLLRRAPLSAAERQRAWDEVIAVVDTPKGFENEDPEALDADVVREVKGMRQRGTDPQGA